MRKLQMPGLYAIVQIILVSPLGSVQLSHST